MIPLADLPALAARFQRFGAYEDALRLYRLALDAEPDDPELLANLGRVLQLLGRHDEALAHLRRALELGQDPGGVHYDIGVSLTALARLDEALDHFDAARRLDPGDPRVDKSAGLARMKQGDAGAAEACFRRALELDPDDAGLAYDLAAALCSLDDRRQAIDWCRRAVELQPAFAEAWLTLGRLSASMGDPVAAAACLERAAQLRPDDPEPQSALAQFLLSQGEPAAAVASYERLLLLQPRLTEAYNNMGLALMSLGRLEDARLSFEQALCLSPDPAEVHNNLGLALMNLGRADEARLCFERAIELKPSLVDAHNNLGLTWDGLGRQDDAWACFERAVALAPDHFAALTNLANACRDQGRAREAIALYRKALAAPPGSAQVHSNLLLAMQYDDRSDPAQLLAEAERYAREHALRWEATPAPPPVRLTADHRLRIGYVSADFREHPVFSFLEPLLAAHNHERIEVYCYSDVSRADAATLRLQAHADVWRSLVGLSDAEAAAVIRGDAIDILIDLAGHTGGNRLPVFARRPAPIQASYLGYLGTTGLPTIDYSLSDAHADPQGSADAFYTEQIVRLPECAFCYRPGPAPAVAPELPADRAGQVTFGCLNNPAKLSDQALALWARVLMSAPGSRLLLRAGGGSRALERIRGIFNRLGIPLERLTFAGHASTRFAYLEQYNTIDIGLDPFPYNGVTTTCDALWMGVPVISLAGVMGASRQGVRFLRTLGLDDLLAGSPDRYVAIAAGLASDRSVAAAHRSTLRDRMVRSPLWDAQRLARNLESIYQDMWERKRTEASLSP